MRPSPPSGRCLAARAVLAGCLLAVAASAAPRTPGPADPDDRLAVLIVSGANNHDWEWTTPSLRRMLERSGRFVVDVTTTPSETLADAEALARYRALVLDYNGPGWGEAANEGVLAAVRAGTGVAVVHAADNAFDGWVEYERLVGHLWREGTGHGRVHAFDVVVDDRDHPITAGLPDLVDHTDELYHRLVHMHDAPVRVLARAFSAPETGGSGRREPMVMVSRFGDGRVFHTPLGHVWKGRPELRASHDDPRFQILVARGVEWAATGTVTLPPTMPNRLTRAEREQGFRLLYDGASLDGWRGYRRDAPPSAGWSGARGALHHAEGGGGGDIVTADVFGDFELRFEFAVSPGGNSGVMVRTTEQHDASWQSAPEFQVLDDLAHPGAEPSTTTAGLYALYPPIGKVLRPAGRWNTARIRLEDGRLLHWLNGSLVVDARLGSDDWDARVARSKFAAYEGFGRAPRGHLCLQDHGDAVWYRSLRILELDDTGDEPDAR